MAADGTTSAGEAPAATRSAPEITAWAAYLVASALVLGIAAAWMAGEIGAWGSPIPVCSGVYVAADALRPAFAFSSDRQGLWRHLRFSRSTFEKPVDESFDCPGLHYMHLAAPFGGGWELWVDPIYLLALTALIPLATLPFRRYRAAARSKPALLYCLLLLPVLASFVAIRFVSPPPSPRYLMLELAGIEFLMVLAWFALAKLAASWKG